MFRGEVGQKISWAKMILCMDIPSSKSLLSWRLIHDSLPTDNKMSDKGIHSCSMCTLCGKHQETAQHLFFDFPHSLNILSWLSSIL